MLSREQCRYCVACLAFYYPLFLLATCVVDLLPAVVRSVVLGHSLDRVDAGVKGFSARSVDGPSTRSGRTPAGNLAVAAGLLLLLWLAPPRLRPMTGLFLAICGTLGGFWWIWMRRAPPWHEFAFVPVLLIGLWFHTRAIQAAWWSRMVAVFVVFVIPATLTQLLTRRGFGIPVQFVLSVATAGAIAILATWKRQAGATAKSWKPALAGFAMTAVAASALTMNGRLQEQAERAKKQQMLEQAQSVPAKDHGRIFFQKGVNFTSEGWAHYGTDASVKTLRAVHAKGVDSIALVPYGGGRAHEPGIRYGNPGMEPDEGIAILTGVAHQLGMKVMLKPQLWVYPGGYPGAIRMPDGAATRQWFEQYKGFAEYYARLAERLHIDLYCVGTEFVHMSKHTEEWRGIISKVREIYHGPLVYAATQGEEFESLAFWDALDYIGLNNYYPLPDDFSTGDILRKVEAVQKKYNKPVILTEAGYVSMEWPNRAPWDETPRALSLEHQARGYEAILKAFWDKPWFAGVYWWRVGSNGEGGPDDGRHTPWGKPAMDVVSRYYTHSGQARSVPMR